MAGPTCPHCGASLAGLGFFAIEQETDEDVDDADELVDDEGPE